MAESSELGARLLETFRTRLRESWQRGERVTVEALLQQHAETRVDDETLLDLVLAEFRLRQELGEQPDRAEYVRRFPQHADRLERLLAADAAPESAVDSLVDSATVIPRIVVPVTLTASDAGSSEQPTVIGAQPPSNATSDARSNSHSASSSTTDSVALGQKLGPYLLLEKLGQGGMGAVYKARQTRLNKIVALKVLPPHLMDNAQAMARFDREMQAVGRLEHPNIVRAMDADEHQGVH